jgi:aromatic-L-amino-acid/L-tryptophan decarboxylase
MTDISLPHAEETLDPVDWESLRVLGRQMVDDMIGYLQTVRDRPVWQPIPDNVRDAFEQPLPHTPQRAEDVYAAFKSTILPYPTGNIHPRFWGWVMGNGTVTGMLAEMLAAGMNLNQGGGSQAGSLVESQVISWCKEMLGFPSSASGLLVSGGSMANLVGLTVARNSRAGFDIRARGVGAAPKPMRLYASTEVHSSVQKAAELLGLGHNALRLITVRKDLTIDPGLLRMAIREDRANGFLPFCVIGCAGTVNTGATDPLEELADLCEQEGLWFHVDGAFGALTALSPELRHFVKGMERADSLAFDMHKWMYLQYEVGCALVRNRELHRSAFALTPHYLEHTNRGVGGGDLWFSDYGVELSRGFRALKIWMAIQEHGIDKFGRLIFQNVQQARYLQGLVRSLRDLELVADVPMNIVCFRYKGDLSGAEALDALNKELLLRLHEEGFAAPSYTVIESKYALRVCITNHRSTLGDFDILVREVLRLGKALEGEMASPPTRFR